MSIAMSLCPAAIVFCDVVGFSKYKDEEQQGVITSLNAEVTKELFPLLGMQGSTPKTICLPTGDGLLVVILEYSDPQILFSLIMTLRLWGNAVTERTGLQPACKLRTGVHFGKVSIIPDINRLPNVCGSDINICRRIMDQARPNQVLFSTAAHDKYIGTKDGAYSGHPFSKELPAVFGPPAKITVKHDVPLDVRVLTQQGTQLWPSDPPLNPPRVIEGQEAVRERSQFINDQLRELLQSRRPEIRIYEQASFSSFSIDPITEAMQKHDPKTIGLLEDQKRLLGSLLKKKGVRMKILLRPIPSEASQKFPELNIRCRALAAWMDANLDVTKGGSVKRRRSAPVEFIELIAPVDSFESAFPNRLIVKDAFRIDGYRLRGIKGHGLSLVYYDETKINQAADDIEALFRTAPERDQSNRAIREKLRVFEPTSN